MLLNIKLATVTTDRGFVSAENTQMLKVRGITDAICPKNPKDFARRNGDPMFKPLQHRRSATEGRIGIFKNVFCGRPRRVKGFAHRELAITWRVLTHNLWVLARPPKKVREPALPLAA